MKKYFLSILMIFTLALALPSQAQSVKFNPDTVRAGRYDNGKMWTFDYPPVEYLEKTYGFKATEEWLKTIRMSALRFATWCSASFVSADGLVMTNHHCSRDVALQVQKPGENFNDNGFMALTQEEERRIPSLFVDQLVKMEDVTDRVQKKVDAAQSDEAKVLAQNTELEAIKKEYSQKEDWKGLTLQSIIFYKGGKFSLYGFKRYNDVRLVAMPELALGYFGGDYDNFTYPRYCLDFTFFRVYDENGQPHKPQYFFKFNPEGAKEGEPVFVIGNPGTTNRQATVSILEYFRDKQYPRLTNLLSTRSKILQEENEKLKSDSLLNVIFGMENSLKAYSGMLKGLQDNYIMTRRKAFEEDFKSNVRKNPKLSNQLGLWDEITKTQDEINKAYNDFYYLQPNPMYSQAFQLANQIVNYSNTVQTSKEAGSAVDEGKIKQMESQISNFKKPQSPELDQKFLTQHFKEAKQVLGDNDEYVKMALKGKKPEEAAADIYKKTKIFDEKTRKTWLEKGTPEIQKSKDPMIELVTYSRKRFNEADKKFNEANTKMTALRAKLARLLFDVYGTSIPPDATFSLRIADGVVKGYDYNGTRAPVNTTFFGLYERFYAFKQKYPWNLPSRWMNPPFELLKEPMNFVSTNDIIGGNSGSPMINAKGEAVGLIFDGNMESLPGNYIYIDDFNRTVSVHAGGIVAALKYIYKNERIAKELGGK